MKAASRAVVLSCSVDTQNRDIRKDSRTSVATKAETQQTQHVLLDNVVCKQAIIYLARLWIVREDLGQNASHLTAAHIPT